MEGRTRVAVKNSFFFSFCLLLCPLLHAQKTINVPADQPTIQLAINAAQNGDTVLVAPGTYTENIDFMGKAITVASSGGAAVTAIDGGGLGRVVTFQTAEGPTSVLSGFTITHGFNSFSGAGVEVAGASPTIQNNVITANQACSGAGMELDGGAAVVRNNTISNNVQVGCTGGLGGGIYAHSAGTAQILNNLITGNQMNNSGSGGAIALDAAGTLTISGNTIQGNSTDGDGAGLWLVNSSDANIIQNLITDNTAAAGGGIYFLVPSGSRGPLLVNNTIANNNAQIGSAVFADGFDGGTQFFNNLLIAPNGPSAVHCGNFANQQPVFDSNDAFSPSGAAYDGICSNQAASASNISVDPLFVNVANKNYHLQSSSPAIDAGTNNAPDLPQQDLDGNQRIAGSTAGCTGIVDLGVYEAGQIVSAAFSPLNLTFGAQPVGVASFAEPISLTATRGCVQISAITVSGDFAQTNNCPATLASGNSCSVQVVFTPTAQGTRTGTLSVSANFTGAAPSASLTGQGGAAIAAVSPGSLVFGNQLVHTTSAAQVVTLSNTGDLPLQISGISITQTFGDFAQTNNCASSLAPGASCSISVTFTPLGSGARSGTLVFSTNTTGTAPIVSLSGTAVAPQMSESPRSLTFASQFVGTTSGSQLITLSNPGTAPLPLTSISTTGDFAQTNNCGSSVAAGASCVISVTFVPTDRFTRSGTLVITSNAIPETDSLALTGTGIAPVAVFSPNSLSFGTQRVNTTSGSQSVSLTNSGDAPLTINGISVTASFSQANNCGTALNPGQSCTILVSFMPTSRGAKGGTLSINGNQPSGSPAVSLSGTGVAPIAALTATLSFAAQVVGTDSAAQSLTLSNNGDAVLDISSIVASGDFLQANSCPPGLAAGASCTIQVIFAPSVSGPRTGTITVADDDPASGTQAASLSGTGVDFMVAASPVSQTITSGRTAQYTVTITAVGGAFPNAIALSCGGAPPESSCSVSPSSVSPSGGAVNATLSIATSVHHGNHGTPAGTFPITVTAVSGNLQRTASVSLVVQ